MADAKILAPERAKLITALCNKADRYIGEGESADATHRYGKVITRHPLGDPSLRQGHHAPPARRSIVQRQRAGRLGVPG